MGTLGFEFLGVPEILHVHVLKSHRFQGELAESEGQYNSFTHVISE